MARLNCLPSPPHKDCTSNRRAVTALRPRCRSGSRPGMPSIRRFGRSFRTSAITRAGISLGSNRQWGAWWRALRSAARSRWTYWSARMARNRRRAADCYPISNHVTPATSRGAARSTRRAFLPAWPVSLTSRSHFASHARAVISSPISSLDPARRSNMAGQDRTGYGT